MAAPVNSQVVRARLSLRRLLRISITVGALLALAYAFWPRNPGAPFSFEVTIRSTLPGFAQLYYDLGAGYNEKDSSRAEIQGRERAVLCKFLLPEGVYSSFRFDPTDRARNELTLSGGRILDGNGHTLRSIAPGQFKPVNDIETLNANDREVTVTTTATAHDPILTLELGEPLALKSSVQPSFRTLLRRFLIAFIVAAGVVVGITPVLFSRIIPSISRRRRQALSFLAAHPNKLLLFSAAASVVLSCYPVVFFGKSFLSPNNHSHTYLLYGEMPTVPDSTQVATDDEKGSDLGAAMWYSWPTSIAESRALLKDGELPLWNRYDSGGLPLLGQGQSMFGDPLHFLVLLTNGAAGWWDLKYVIAKFLFAASLAFCVLKLTRHLPAALIISLSAPFIGFFSYRYSHPAFFSLCYAPLIYLAWVNLMAADKGSLKSLWVGLMVLANWTVMNSGTVKEAYVLLLAMNLCGCLTLLFSRTQGKRSKLGLALGAQFIFILVGAPVWMTFLHTLHNSWTVYETGGAFQLQPSLFIGLFDDIFYRQFNADEMHLDPSANFLMLGAVLWFCFSRNRREASPDCWGPVLTCLLACAMVFGVIPPSLIARLPFIGRIYHVDNTFSDVAIICLLLLAGLGIKTFWIDCRTFSFNGTALRVCLALAGLLALYLGTTEAVQRSTRALLHSGDQMPKSPFFWFYSLTLLLGLALASWAGRSALIRQVRTWHIVSLAAAFFLLHWRHGMHLETPFDPYVMNPQPRTNLIADSSPAVKLISSEMQQPGRVLGLGYDFAPGYGSAIGLEQVDSAAPLLNRDYKSLIDAFGARLLLGSSKNGTVDDQLERNLPLFQLLNVRYFLGHAGSKAASIPSLRSLAERDLAIYESRGVWPRAFFTSRYVPYEDETQFIDLIRTDKGPFAAIAHSEFEENSALKELAPRNDPDNNTIVPAVNYRLTSNTTSFNVTTPGPGVVVLTEPYIPEDFLVWVNGKLTNYFRVNGAFKAVVVPQAGTYTVTYSYWPANLNLSLWLALAGAAFLLPMLIFVAKRT